ncbi:MAG: acetyltransferase [Pseudomonadota bacterium]
MKTGSVVIFGCGNFASLVWYCLTHDSDLRVEAFTVDRAFVNGATHEGLPVLPFDELEALYPPSQIDLLIPLGYKNINGVRRERFEQARARGYRFANYISSRASVWADLKVGENCIIGEHAIIQPYVTLGDNVIIRGGAHVSHHSTVASHGYVATQATLGAGVRMDEQAFVGVGAVLRDGLQIGARSFVGAGAVLLEDAAADSVYLGNPARLDSKTAREATA